MVKAILEPIIGALPHPFRLRRQRPFVRIEVADQPPLNPRLTKVRATGGIVKLRLVGHDVLPPSPVEYGNGVLQEAATTPMRAVPAADK